MRIFEIVNNYEEILDRIIHSSPKTKIYVQSVLPTKIKNRSRTDSIKELNKRIEILANEKSLKYINLYDSFVDSNGDLNMELSLDGLHLNGQGYLIWKELIEDDVNN
jgi:lysophospholipase L1-like esterase